MATKWRSFPNWFYHSALKWFACVLIVVCTGTSMLMGIYINAHVSYANITDESYLSSNYRASDMSSMARSVTSLLKIYQNEDFVRSGGTVSMERLKQELVEKYYNRYYNDYRDSLEPVDYEEYETVLERNAKTTRAMLEEKILTERAEELENNRQEAIVQELQNYFSLVEALNRSEGMYYYAADGKSTVSNVSGATKEFFLSQPAYLLFDHGKYEQDSQLAYYSELSGLSPDDEVYVAYSAEEVAQRETIFQQDRQYLDRVILYIILMLALDLFAFLYLLFAAGHRAGEDAVQFCPVDRIYTDVIIVLGIIVGVLTGAACAGIFDYMDGYHQYAQRSQQIVGSNSLMREPVIFISLSAALYAGLTVVLTLFLSLIRQIKARQFLSHSLVGAVIRKIWRGFRWLVNKGPILIVSTQQLNMVHNGVQKVKNGELAHRINLPPGKTLYRLAQDINTMSDGLQKAVEKELQAERLKTELITNVSHDLKTPLTSIINYSDLLTKENLVPDYANDYAKVLKDKSEKLKQLTNDLFEISKVQSGNIEVHTEKLQVKVLIMQALAEYEERFRESGLDVRVSPVPDELFILSDGRKMARVLENLVVNILKYAQPQTRVYVDVLERDGKCEITFKNISNYEMNFSADEIVQRFARGDESRTTEGNGLGLAIVQSYVEACGGAFRIDVDGDLFKATISFDILTEQA